MTGAILRPIAHDEAFGLWTAELRSSGPAHAWADMLTGLLDQLGERAAGRRWLVLGLPPGLGRDTAIRCLVAAGRQVDELVIMADETWRRASGALAAADLRGLCDRPRMRVVFDADRERAIESTILRLRPGDQCWVVAPPEPGPSLSLLIARGLCLRGD